MNLEQIAQQAMDYLDSVSVPAEYEIANGKLTIITDDRFFIYIQHKHRHSDLVAMIKSRYPQKSPS